MKRARLFAILLVFAIAANAQGVRMSADFLPLAAGNRWTYAVTGEDGKKQAEAEFAIQEHRIVAGRSFYVITGYPFVSDPADPNDKVRLLGYDRLEREFIRIVNDKESALFLADGADVRVLEQDNGGLPQKIQLRLDTMTLTFQRGLGIVEARIEAANGVRLFKLDNARIGESKLSGNAGAPSLAVPEQPRKTGVISAVTANNPQLRLDAVAAAQGIQMSLTVVNASEKLLPFRFTSGQSHDFAVSNAAGQEIWNWSKSQSFAAVIRSEALRAKGTWKFEALWDRKDNSGKPVAAGEYQVTARLTSQPPLESKPVSITVPGP